MIISHKHKFIFLKTRKTAGTSIEMMLSSICGDEDVLTPMHHKDENVRVKVGARPTQNHYIPLKYYTKMELLRFMLTWERLFLTGHLTAPQIKQRVDDDVWNSYYKFAFDRNPFDKVVSLFYWFKAEHQLATVREFIEQGWLSHMSSYDLYSIGGRVAVDKIYRYEEMEESLSDLTQKLSLDQPLKLLAYQAKANIRPKKGYHHLLDEWSVAQIRIIYAREIALLGYEF